MILGKPSLFAPFLTRNSDKEIVAVQGLGFVGTVMALVVADAPCEDYAVIGVDRPTDDGRQKVEALNSGFLPIDSADSSVDKLLRRALDRENFVATCDESAYEHADIILINVGLDVQKDVTSRRELRDYDVDLDGFKSACRAIASRCKPDVLIIVETTVPPGTSLEVVRPIFDSTFEQRGIPKNYRLGHSYERVMPGPDYVDSVRNFYRVYAGMDEGSANATRDFLQTVINTDDYPPTRLDSITACETAKVLENAYRAMNIAFVQEWTEFAEELGINLYEVIRAIRKRPTHSNLMFPGLGVGGYCLPKDPLLASWARKRFSDGEKRLPQSERAVELNDQMPEHTFELIRNGLGGSVEDCTISFLGVSYRGGVGDTRNTPASYLYDLLLEEGANVFLHDPFVEEWSEKGRSVSQDLSEVLVEDVDAVVFATPHSTYTDNGDLQKRLHGLPANRLIHDAWGVLSNGEIGALQTRHRVQVTGRGDLASTNPPVEESVASDQPRSQ